MLKRVFSILIILVLVFSLTACKSSDDEESAELVDSTANSDNTENQNQGQSDNNSDNQNNQNSNEDNNSQNNNSQDNNQPSGNDDDNKQEQLPPLSEKGKYTVVFDFGYDNKMETEKTDGKATNMDISRTGYTFEGWFDGDDKWDFSNEVTKDLTLKAKWTIIEYKISYTANGATLPTTNPTSYTTDKSYDLAPATMTGKSFLGWSISNGKESFTSTSIPKGMFGDLTLSPVWDDSVVILGKYEQDGNTENGKEDIEWTKIKEENGKVLLISNKILDAKQYDPVGGSGIRWATCALRKFLNESFYKASFTQEERDAIIQTEIHTPGNFDNSKSNDYVFILSIEEAKQLLPSYSGRQAHLTEEALKNQAQNSPVGGWWWLRTKISDYGAALVENDGNIRSIGYTCKMTTIGFRPCIWVDASKIS